MAFDPSYDPNDPEDSGGGTTQPVVDPVAAGVPAGAPAAQQAPVATVAQAGAPTATDAGGMPATPAPAPGESPQVLPAVGVSAPPKNPGFFDGVNGIPGMSPGIPEGVTEGLESIYKQRLGFFDKLSSSMTGRMDKDRQQIQKAFDAQSAGADTLKPWNEEEQRRKHTHDPIQSFGSLGSVLGILASAFTHQPFENSLLAASSAINAINAYDDREYERSYRAWQDNSTLAIRRNQMQQQAYQNAIKLMDVDMNAFRTQFELEATRFKDEKALFLLRNGLDADVIKLVESRNKLAADFAKSYNDIAEKGFKNTLLENDPDWGVTEESEPDPAKRYGRKLAAFNRVYRPSNSIQQEAMARMLMENPDATAEDMGRLHQQFFGYGSRPINADQAAVQMIMQDPLLSEEEKLKKVQELIASKRASNAPRNAEQALVESIQRDPNIPPEEKQRRIEDIYNRKKNQNAEQAAVEAIKRDPNLSEEEKKQKLEEMAKEKRKSARSAMIQADVDLLNDLKRQYLESGEAKDEIQAGLMARNTLSEARRRPKPRTQSEADLQLQDDIARRLSREEGLDEEQATLQAKKIIADAKKPTAKATESQMRADMIKKRAEELRGKDPNLSETEAYEQASAQIKSRTQSEGTLTDKAVDTLARQIISGDRSGLTNLGRNLQGGNNVVRVRNRVAQLLEEQGISPEEASIRAAEFEGIKAAQRTIGTRVAAISVSAAEARGGIEIARDASAVVPRGKFVPWNKLNQMYLSATSNRPLWELRTALNSLVNEYANVISRTGVATDSSRHEARELMNSAIDHNALSGVFRIMEEEIKRAEEAAAKARQKFREGLGTQTLKEGGAAAPPVNKPPAEMTDEEILRRMGVPEGEIKRRLRDKRSEAPGGAQYASLNSSEDTSSRFRRTPEDPAVDDFESRFGVWLDDPNLPPEERIEFQRLLQDYLEENRGARPLIPGSEGVDEFGFRGERGKTGHYSTRRV